MKSTVISAKVETIYTVEVSFADFAEAKSAWIADDKCLRTMYPKAFDNEDTTMGTLHNEFRQFQPHGDRDSLLAKFLGYDGWNNGLSYHDNTKTLTFVVYNRGCRM